MKRRCHHPMNRLINVGDELHCSCGKVIVGKKLSDEAIRGMTALAQAGYRGAFSLTTGKPVNLKAV